jgi:hypothetical protein
MGSGGLHPHRASNRWRLAISAIVTKCDTSAIDAKQSFIKREAGDGS